MLRIPLPLPRRLPLALLLACLCLPMAACDGDPTGQDPVPGEPGGPDPGNPDPGDPNPDDPDPGDPDPGDPDPGDPDPGDPDPGDPDPDDPDPGDPDPDDPDPGDPDPALLSLVLNGWQERGAAVTLVASGEEGDIDPAGATWTYTPESAVEVLGPGRVRLLAVGSVDVRAEWQGAVGDLTIDVAPPPEIVFDRLVDGNRDIWRAALDGGELTRLTTDPGDDSAPSHAAGRIVFVSFRDGNGELYGMNASGGAPRRITETADAERSPALAPDGERVAYLREVNGTPKLWSVDWSGEGAEQFHAGAPGEIHAGPAWHPGGEQLAFVTTATGMSDVYRLAAAGGAATPLATGPRAEVEPAWDRTGERLAFVSNRDGDTELYLLDVATSTITRLTDRVGSDGQPIWLADGRIVYVARVGEQRLLRWLDPADPSVTHDIPTGPGDAGHPAALY